MAKALRESPPTSSVARLLDPAAAARAIAPPAAEPTPSSPPETAIVLSMPHIPAPSTEPATVSREFVLSPSTAEAFDQLVDLFRRATGTRLTNSHVARAMLKGVAHCMESIQREAKRIPPMKLPSNARGREAERERFENRLAEALVSGIRAAAAFDDE